MASAYRFLQYDFSAGHVDPMVEANLNLSQKTRGLKKSVNTLHNVNRTVSKRPGTRQIGNALDMSVNGSTLFVSMLDENGRSVCFVITPPVFDAPGHIYSYNTVEMGEREYLITDWPSGESFKPKFAVYRNFLYITRPTGVGVYVCRNGNLELLDETFVNLPAKSFNAIAFASGRLMLASGNTLYISRSRTSEQKEDAIGFPTWTLDFTLADWEYEWAMRKMGFNAPGRDVRGKVLWNCKSDREPDVTEEPSFGVTRRDETREVLAHDMMGSYGTYDEGWKQVKEETKSANPGEDIPDTPEEPAHSQPWVKYVYKDSTYTASATRHYWNGTPRYLFSSRGETAVKEQLIDQYTSSEEVAETYDEDTGEHVYSVAVTERDYGAEHVDGEPERRNAPRYPEEWTDNALGTMQYKWVNNFHDETEWRFDGVDWGAAIQVNASDEVKENTIVTYGDGQYAFQRKYEYARLDDWLQALEEYLYITDGEEGYSDYTYESETLRWREHYVKDEDCGPEEVKVYKETETLITETVYQRSPVEEEVHYYICTRYRRRILTVVAGYNVFVYQGDYSEGSWVTGVTAPAGPFTSYPQDGGPNARREDYYTYSSIVETKKYYERTFHWIASDFQWTAETGSIDDFWTTDDVDANAEAIFQMVKGNYDVDDIYPMEEIYRATEYPNEYGETIRRYEKVTKEIKVETSGLVTNRTLITTTEVLASSPEFEPVSFGDVENVSFAKTPTVYSTHGIEIQENDMFGSRIQWIAHLGRVIVGTDTAVFMATTQGVSAQNFDLVLTSGTGCCDLVPKVVNSYLVFVSSDRRKIYEAYFSNESQGLLISEASIASRDLFRKGIEDFWVCDYPDMVIAAKVEGKLLVCTPSYADGGIVFAWSKWNMGIASVMQVKTADFDTEQYKILLIAEADEGVYVPCLLMVGDAYDSHDVVPLMDYMVHLTADNVSTSEESEGIYNWTVTMPASVRRWMWDTQQVMLRYGNKALVIKDVEKSSKTYTDAEGTQTVDVFMFVATMDATGLDSVVVGLPYMMEIGFFQQMLPNNSGIALSSRHSVREMSVKVFKSFGGQVRVGDDYRQDLPYLVYNRDSFSPTFNNPQDGNLPYRESGVLKIADVYESMSGTYIADNPVRCVVEDDIAIVSEDPFPFNLMALGLLYNITEVN